MSWIFLRTALISAGSFRFTMSPWVVLISLSSSFALRIFSAVTYIGMFNPP